ncbi:hypothetical protein FOA52_011701 [Chlamydomonas sp. UWO 241]|nr:hypothetical protein FOA52_011701 [Chlamydomonas sp. UWO 241]
MGCITSKAADDERENMTSKYEYAMPQRTPKRKTGMEDGRRTPRRTPGGSQADTKLGSPNPRSAGGSFIGTVQQGGGPGTPLRSSRPDAAAPGHAHARGAACNDPSSTVTTRPSAAAKQRPPDLGEEGLAVTTEDVVVRIVIGQGGGAAAPATPAAPAAPAALRVPERGSPDGSLSFAPTPGSKSSAAPTPTGAGLFNGTPPPAGLGDGPPPAAGGAGSFVRSRPVIRPSRLQLASSMLTSADLHTPTDSEAFRAPAGRASAPGAAGDSPPLSMPTGAGFETPRCHALSTPNAARSAAPHGTPRRAPLTDLAPSDSAPAALQQHMRAGSMTPRTVPGGALADLAALQHVRTGSVTSRPVPNFSLSSSAASPARRMSAMATLARYAGGATASPAVRTGVAMPGRAWGGETPGRAWGGDTPGRAWGGETPGRAAAVRRAPAGADSPFGGAAGTLAKAGTPAKSNGGARPVRRDLYGVDSGEIVEVPGAEELLGGQHGVADDDDGCDALDDAPEPLPMFVCPVLPPTPASVLELGRLMYQHGDADTEDVEQIELTARSANVSTLSRALFALKNSRGDGPMFSPGKASAAMAGRICAVGRYTHGVGHSKADNCNAAAYAIVAELAALPVSRPDAHAVSVLRHCLHEFGAEECDLLEVQGLLESAAAGDVTEEAFALWLGDLQRSAGRGRVLPRQGRALMDTARAVTAVEVGPMFGSRLGMLRAVVQASLGRAITI